eukprot:5204730-Pleurochrysis_carterae.AAC.1
MRMRASKHARTRVRKRSEAVARAAPVKNVKGNQARARQKATLSTGRKKGWGTNSREEKERARQQRRPRVGRAWLYTRKMNPKRAERTSQREASR